MWPSDQRLEGGMMTYRGKGHTQVKVSLHCSTTANNSHNKVAPHCQTTARTQAAWQEQPKTKAKPWQQHSGKVIALATAPSVKHCIC